MSIVLTSAIGGDFKPHPEGIHPAVCVDVIELGLMETEFQGQRRMVNKVRLAFETEQKTDEGKNCLVTKTFSATLHPKSKLADSLGRWRGRPIVPGESIDLAKLIGACCTLVISHRQNMVGRTYASIDAFSKPTKKLVPSGHYDPVLARQRIEEWKAREQAVPAPHAAGAVRTTAPRYAPPLTPDPSPEGRGEVLPDGHHKSAAAGASRTGEQAPAAKVDFDPEIGF